MAGNFVVVSGVPAGGTSTLATALGNTLAMPVLDKDDFLEELVRRISG